MMVLINRESAHSPNKVLNCLKTIIYSINDECIFGGNTKCMPEKSVEAIRMRNVGNMINWKSNSFILQDPIDILFQQLNVLKIKTIINKSN